MLPPASIRTLRLLLWGAGFALGILAEWVAFEWDEPGDWVPDLVAGWTLIACGLIGWSRRPESRTGALLTATGFAWFAANFVEPALYLHRGPLVQLVLTYPHGRLRDGLERAAVAVAYAAAVLSATLGSETATFALSALIVLVAVRGYARAAGRERRIRLATLGATVLVAAVLAGTAAARLAFPSEAVEDASLLVYEAALCMLAIALVAGLIREPWARARVTDLVVDVGTTRSGTLRDALADALGDPSLEVGYPLGDGYVDVEGRPLELPEPGAGRRVTAVGRDGESIAVLVHDPAVLDDPGLSAALAAAARLAAANARLQADIRAQVLELQASRRRLLQAGDEERSRIERRLRDSVERRLGELAQMLEGAPLDPAQEQLARTRDELRELAAGLHPGALEHGTLADAIAALARRSPVPVQLSAPSAALPDGVATAAYFVCAEALANVAKYASASRVVIAVSVGETTVRLSIEDDGVGGADPAAGSGLRGLADRLDALGGTLAIDSPPGGGTRVTAELPLDGPSR